jgi:hypothetical protein
MPEKGRLVLISHLKTSSGRVKKTVGAQSDTSAVGVHLSRGNQKYIKEKRIPIWH